MLLKLLFLHPYDLIVQMWYLPTYITGRTSYCLPWFLTYSFTTKLRQCLYPTGAHTISLSRPIELYENRPSFMNYLTVVDLASTCFSSYATLFCFSLPSLVYRHTELFLLLPTCDCANLLSVLLLLPSAPSCEDTDCVRTNNVQVAL